ncbi:hypothetical protein P171DRAFT_477231 [Karstenula rhodostoma CBS 690.94]|uniref:Uncharacterized protein n=1 Tax=Karstenula rhodostoma CBS 690.94 TaxID=1392251 RepID=A0A9P4P7P6_9PLEO|nr:hypothetical protein P171DRAFT_477231 [Karstenula rhodostoma CBS 690.94]
MSDELSTLLAPLLAPTLRHLLAPIPLTPLSRLPPSRLLTTALPHIHTIELVSPPAFAAAYAPLYTTLFHGPEREHPSLIVSRLRHAAEGKRAGLAPYRVVGLRGEGGKVLGAAQFSVLLLNDGLAVPYLQYIYTSPEHRRQDLSEVLHTLVLAVSLAEATNHINDTAHVAVPFTLFETEPPTHGADDPARQKAKTRTTIHAQSGSRALMLRRLSTPSASPSSSHTYLSAHVQPGLELNDPPLTLIWVVRPNPDPALHTEDLDVGEIGPALMAAVYRSFRDEGFLEANIALAEEMARRRGVGAEFCLMELGRVEEGMYVGID